MKLNMTDAVELVGFCSLSVGLGFEFGWAWSAIVCGAICFIIGIGARFRGHVVAKEGKA